MKSVYLSLGSNLGDRAWLLQQSLDELAAHDVHIDRVSPVYETEPQGLRDQKWFLNIAVEAHTYLFPMQLLLRIKKIEHKLQRRRTILNGPRTIDIDIIFFGDFVLSTTELQIPHPRYADRRFVLAPLADIAPDLCDPVTHHRVADLLAALPGQTVKPSEHRVKCKDAAYWPA